MGGGRRRRTGSRIVATISMAMFTYALDPFLLPLPILSLESTHFFPEENGKLKMNTTGSEITLLENFSYWTLAFELPSGHYLTNRPIMPLFVPTPPQMFNQALADSSTNTNPHLIDGMVLTKFDTVDDKVGVGAALSMSNKTGQPAVFVGTGKAQTGCRAYRDI